MTHSVIPNLFRDLIKMLKRVQHDKKIIIISFFITFNFLTLVVNRVWAQQITLSLSPPLLEVFIKPGKSIMVAYSLKNLGDPTIIKCKILPFIPADNMGNIKLKEEFEGPIRFSFDNSEIKIDQAFFLKSKDYQQLLLRIRVPEGAPEGDYYYTLLAETQPPPGTEGIVSSQAKATIGANIIITVTESGQVDIKGKIALFEILPRFKLNILGNIFRLFDSNDKIPVVLVVENKGKNVIKPQGEINLRGNFGEKATFDILPQNILAESQRLVSATPSAEFDHPTSLTLAGFFIGNYKLSTTVNFGEGSPNVFASTSFLAIPFKLIFGFIIAIIVGIIIVTKLRKED